MAWSFFLLPTTTSAVSTPKRTSNPRLCNTTPRHWTYSRPSKTRQSQTPSLMSVLSTCEGRITNWQSKASSNLHKSTTRYLAVTRKLQTLISNWVRLTWGVALWWRAINTLITRSKWWRGCILALTIATSRWRGTSRV